MQLLLLVFVLFGSHPSAAQNITSAPPPPPISPSAVISTLTIPYLSGASACSTNQIFDTSILACVTCPKVWPFVDLLFSFINFYVCTLNIDSDMCPSLSGILSSCKQSFLCTMWHLTRLLLLDCGWIWNHHDMDCLTKPHRCNVKRLHLSGDN